MPPPHHSDRPTLVDEGEGYRAYIAATEIAGDAANARATQRIAAEELAELQNASRLTGRVKPVVLPSAYLRARSEARPDVSGSRWRLPLALLAAAGALAAGGAFAWHRRAEQGLRPASAASAPPKVTVPAAAPASASDAPSATASSTTSAAPSPVEAQARAAMERLRAGLDDCIRRGLRSLPGSSPAIPPALPKARAAPYLPPATTWRTAVWSCAHFEIAEPMRFEIQWQLVRPGAEGLGIAWMDLDDDGVADRALGFTIKLGPRGDPETGEIVAMDPAKPVVLVR